MNLIEYKIKKITNKMAKQFKGTKEKLEINPRFKREVFIKANDELIAVAAAAASENGEILAQANAKLISKSPELMKFVMFIASHEKGSAPSVGYFEEIIKKAETILDEILE